MVTKSTQTQSGGKYDGQFHEKRSKKGKKAKRIHHDRFMPGNAVIMLIFQIKRINLSPKNEPCRSFFLFFKNSKKLGLSDDTNRRNKGGWPFNIGINLPQSIKV